MAEQLSARLKNKVKIYGGTEVTNSVGEKDVENVLLASVWCDIVPKSGKVTDIPSAAARYETVTHEMTFRRSAQRYLRAENYVMHGKTRYDIEYVMPHFNMPDRVVAYCREVIGL